MATTTITTATATDLEVVSDSPALPIEQALEAHWSRAERWLTAIKQLEVSRLAAQVMAGFELIHLHEHYRIKPGKRTDLMNLPHRVGGSWEELVKERLSISDQTAWRWMEMAKAARPRLKKLGGENVGALIELMLTNPAAVPAEQIEEVQAAVSKLTDGRSQVEFMAELGLVKAPQGSAAKGGRLEPKHAPVAELNPAEQEALTKQIAHDNYHRLVAHLDTELCQLHTWRYLPRTTMPAGEESVTLPMLLGVLKTAVSLIEKNLAA